MKLIISPIFYFFAPSLIIFETGEGRISYGSLIEKVYDEYRTFGVIIATTNDLSLEKMTVFQMILREMSVRQIGMVIVNFMHLEETVRFHHKQSARPLIVIFTDEMTEIYEFKDGIINVPTTYPVWLVVFTGDEHEDACEYWHEPIGDPFKTEMLISCCNSSSIVKMWSRETNYSSLTFHDEEIDKESHLVWRNGNQLYGYLGEIVTELSRLMNFSITYVWEEPLGVYQPGTSTWTGIIGTIARGEADIGVATIVRNAERVDIIDFSSTLIRAHYTLHIAQPVRPSIQWNGFLKVFQSNIWMVIILLLLITPVLLIITDYKKNCNLYDMISMHYLNVWGLFCQQSWSRPPKEKPSKIIFLSLFLSTLVVNAGYSAALIRHLTTAPAYVQFRTVQEFVNDGTYKVTAVHGSAMFDWIQRTNDTLMKKLKTMMKPSKFLPTSIPEGLKQVCTEKVAFVDATTEGNFQKEYPPCQSVSFKIGEDLNFGMIFPLNSEYTGLVNYHIQRFRESGVLNRLKQKYFVKTTLPARSYVPVSFEGIVPALTSFAIGSLIAFIILRFEKR